MLYPWTKSVIKAVNLLNIIGDGAVVVFVVPAAITVIYGRSWGGRWRWHVIFVIFVQ